MSGEDKDPFDCLSQITSPEPDPEKIKAVAARSADVFAQSSRTKPNRASKGWLGKFLPGRTWLLPASGAFATLAVALLALPMLVKHSGPNGETLQDIPTRPPSLAREEQQGAASEQETRLGSMPQRQRPGTPLDMRDDAKTQTYDFDDLTILSRSVPNEFGLYLVVDGVETQFLRGAKAPSADIVLTDAFVRDALTGEGGKILFVKSGYLGGAQRWDAFIDNGKGFVLSDSLSQDISEAGDRIEVLAIVNETGEN